MFNLTPQEQKVILCILLILLIGIGYQWYRDGRIIQESPKPLIVPNPAFGPPVSSTPSVSTTETIVVHINGAVKKPGIYNLPKGSRIYNLIQAAGDTTGDADITNLNYAEPLQDGEKIEVPSFSVVTQTTTLSAVAPPNVFLPNQNVSSPMQLNNPSRRPPIITSRRININMAGIGGLDTLPGIGSALAQRIIDYRNQHGNFRNIEQIKDVKGIGDKKFEAIRNLITI